MLIGNHLVRYIWVCVFIQVWADSARLDGQVSNYSPHDIDIMLHISNENSLPGWAFVSWPIIELPQESVIHFESIMPAEVGTEIKFLILHSYDKEIAPETNRISNHIGQASSVLGSVTCEVSGYMMLDLNCRQDENIILHIDKKKGEYALTMVVYDPKNGEKSV